LTTIDREREGRTEDGVDNVIGAGEGAVEIVREGHVELLELGGQPGVEVALAAFRVEDGWAVAVVMEVSCGDEAIAA
jgi:hypothetical protein